MSSTGIKCMCYIPKCFFTNLYIKVFMDLWHRVCTVFPMAKLPTMPLHIIYLRGSHLGQLLPLHCPPHTDYAVSSFMSSFWVLWISCSLFLQKATRYPLWPSHHSVFPNLFLFLWGKSRRWILAAEIFHVIMHCYLLNIALGAVSTEWVR